MEFNVGQQKDEWKLHQDYSSLHYAGSFWYVFYGKKDFSDELLHSIEDDDFKATVAEVNNCIFFMFSLGSNKWVNIPYEPHLEGKMTSIPPIDEESPSLFLILGVDTTTGCLKCIRDITLRGKIIKQLHDLSRKHLADETISSHSFVGNLQDTFMQYHTTEELIRQVGFENLYICADVL